MCVLVCVQGCMPTGGSVEARGWSIRLTLSSYLRRQTLLLNLKLIGWPIRKLQDLPVLALSPGVADALPGA